MTRAKAQLIFAVLLLGGCASTDRLSEQMAGWQDRDINVAIAAWGSPDSSGSFNEGEILVWYDYAALPVSHSDESFAPPVVCQRMLAVAPDGTITGWRWRGDACASSDSTESRPQLVATTRTR